MKDVETCALDGVFLRRLDKIGDARGSFVKPFHRPSLAEIGINFEVAEFFYSFSIRGALRGMHFQVPPNDHDKIVCCMDGSVLDVVVDLRRSSPTFGRSVAFDLDCRGPAIVFIPRGCAHGFLTRSETATLAYLVSTAHTPTDDRGVRWDSLGFAWPDAAPIVSDRDKSFPALSEFETPFA